MMPHDPIALALAGLYGLSILAVVFIAARAARQPMVPPPDPAFRDLPSVEDLKLALEHDALVEEVEVAFLDSIWALPTREPSR